MKSFIFVLLLASSAFAQKSAPPTGSNTTPQTTTPATVPTTTDTTTNQTLFRCTLPGGTYEVAIRAILAVASHEYVVDGIARVTEVNIDTAGSMLARFYYIEPNTPNAPSGIGAATLEKAQQLFQEAADRTGQDAWKKVVKNYPTTTHARTAEYRVTSKDQLTTIYTAAEQAFRLGKTTMITVQ